MSRKDEAIRRARYGKLKKAGFSAKEATKYKDLSDERIDILVCIKLEYEAKKQDLLDLLNESVLKCVKGEKSEISVRAVLQSGKDEEAD